MRRLIIFDFDGVLVETERATFEWYRQALVPYGVTLKDEDFALKSGQKSIDFFKAALGGKFDSVPVDELIAGKRAAFLADVPRYVKPIPGGSELVAACRKAGLALAIGSQNERELLDAAVAAFGWEGMFDVVTSLQDIKRKKPDPEVFQLVLARTGIPGAEAVVIEDSPHGVEAALAAGCAAVAVTTSFPAEAFRGAALAAPSVASLTPEMLTAL
jgi:HAD superfamily hydrolase (TIGR01509 family)